VSRPYIVVIDALELEVACASAEASADDDDVDVTVIWPALTLVFTFMSCPPYEELGLRDW